MATNNNLVMWKDLDNEFNVHPVSGDVQTLQDSVAVRRSVRNLVLTSFGQRVDAPDIGSGIYYLLFEPANAVTAQRISAEIESCIRNFEPRITAVAVMVEPQQDKNMFKVNINFQIKQTREVAQITLFLDRIR